eukprot:SM000029S10543  [mRNA]  locus=s29:780403:786312:+ [translate_table: standard]
MSGSGTDYPKVAAAVGLTSARPPATSGQAQRHAVPRFGQWSDPATGPANYTAVFEIAKAGRPRPGWDLPDLQPPLDSGSGGGEGGGRGDQRGPVPTMERQGAKGAADASPLSPQLMAMPEVYKRGDLLPGDLLRKVPNLSRDAGHATSGRPPQPPQVRPREAQRRRYREGGDGAAQSPQREAFAPPLSYREDIRRTASDGDALGDVLSGRGHPGSPDFGYQRRRHQTVPSHHDPPPQSRWQAPEEGSGDGGDARRVDRDDDYLGSQRAFDDVVGNLGFRDEHRGGGGSRGGASSQSPARARQSPREVELERQRSRSRERSDLEQLAERAGIPADLAAMDLGDDSPRRARTPPRPAPHYGGNNDGGGLSGDLDSSGGSGEQFTMPLNRARAFLEQQSASRQGSIRERASLRASVDSPTRDAPFRSFSPVRGEEQREQRGSLTPTRRAVIAAYKGSATNGGSGGSGSSGSSSSSSPKRLAPPAGSYHHGHSRLGPAGGGGGGGGAGGAVAMRQGAWQGGAPITPPPRTPPQARHEASPGGLLYSPDSSRGSQSPGSPSSARDSPFRLATPPNRRPYHQPPLPSPPPPPPLQQPPPRQQDLQYQQLLASFEGVQGLEDLSHSVVYHPTYLRQRARQHAEQERQRELEMEVELGRERELRQGRSGGRRDERAPYVGSDPPSDVSLEATGIPAAVKAMVGSGASPPASCSASANSSFEFTPQDVAAHYGKPKAAEGGYGGRFGHPSDERSSGPPPSRPPPMSPPSAVAASFAGPAAAGRPPLRRAPLPPGSPSRAPPLAAPYAPGGDAAELERDKDKAVAQRSAVVVPLDGQSSGDESREEAVAPVKDVLEVPAPPAQTTYYQPPADTAVPLTMRFDAARKHHGPTPTMADVGLQSHNEQAGLCTSSTMGPLWRCSCGVSQITDPQGRAKSASNLSFAAKSSTAPALQKRRQVHNLVTTTLSFVALAVGISLAVDALSSIQLSHLEHPGTDYHLTQDKLLQTPNLLKVLKNMGVHSTAGGLVHGADGQTAPPRWPPRSRFLHSNNSTRQTCPLAPAMEGADDHQVQGIAQAVSKRCAKVEHIASR